MNNEPIVRTKYGDINLSDIPIVVNDNELRKISLYLFSFAIFCIFFILLTYTLYTTDIIKRNRTINNYIYPYNKTFSVLKPKKIKGRYIQLYGVIKNNPFIIDEIKINNIVFPYNIKHKILGITPINKYTIINLDLKREYNIERIDIKVKDFNENLTNFKIIIRNINLEKVYESFDFLGNQKLNTIFINA